MSKMIIINADDFGLNSSVNKAIAEAFSNGLINSTTLMANMAGFEEAVDLANKYEFTQRIGAHLVLTDGTPLTEEIKSLDFLFNGITRYKKSRYLIFFLKKSNQKLIYNEFAAQIEKIQSKNIQITHLDTHHHVHEIYIITKILLDLGKKYNIPFIRILNNLEKSTKLYKRVYRKFINYYIMKKHANFSDIFGDRSDFLVKTKEDHSIIKKMEKNIEVMVHPDYNVDGKLIDKDCTREFNFI
jgi:predicted glycoside hydrolase/deacetylase ChbG (UPF0249 family)